MSCDFLIPIKKTAKDIFKKYKYKETVYLRVVLVSNLVTTVHDYWAQAFWELISADNGYGGITCQSTSFLTGDGEISWALH
jgi:hypothetical protein